MTRRVAHGALAAGLRPAPGARVPLRARHAVPGPGRGGAVCEVRPAAVARAGGERRRAARARRLRRFGRSPYGRGRRGSSRLGATGTGAGGPRPPGRATAAQRAGNPRDRRAARSRIPRAFDGGRGVTPSDGARSLRILRLRARLPRYLALGAIALLALAGLRAAVQGPADAAPTQPIRVEGDIEARGLAEAFARDYLSWDAARPEEYERRVRRLMTDAAAEQLPLLPRDGPRVGRAGPRSSASGARAAGASRRWLPRRAPASSTSPFR